MLSEKATCNNQKTMTPQSLTFSELLDYQIAIERGTFFFLKLSVFLCSIVNVGPHLSL
jgi:hypothetical protein